MTFEIFDNGNKTSSQITSRKSPVGCDYQLNCTLHITTCKCSTNLVNNFTINVFKVLNSLEAKSSSIVVRVNLTTQKIQVIDNGLGISKKNLKLIGHRYATSKYYSSKELENKFRIGINRGEALASIINLSKNVKITSRIIDTKKTYNKIFEEGKSLSVNSTKDRPSKGTTVEIQNLLYNRPVRKKCLNNIFLLEEIKQELEHLALIYPKVSISLRNNSTGEIILRTYCTQFVCQTVSLLYGKDFSKKFRKLSFSKNKISLNGIISIKPQVQNKFQHVYVNYRYIKKCQIHSSIISLILKSKILNKDFADAKEKYSAFIINIKCSHSEIDILEYFDLKIEFKDWDKLISFVETGVTQFLQKENLLEVKEKPENDFLKGSPISQKVPSIHISQCFGVIKGIPKKRKCIAEEIKTKSVSLPKSETEEPVLNIVEGAKISLPKNLLMWSASISHHSNCNKSEDIQTIVLPIKQPEPSQIKQNILKPLNGKQLIMNMFLKSTAIFTVDKDLVDELLEMKPKDMSQKRNSSVSSIKGTNSTSADKYCASNNQNNIAPNDEEFKLNFRSSVFNKNCKDEVIFKKPLPVTKNKSSYHINRKINHKLQHNNHEISQNILSKLYCEKKLFYKLFVRELCSRVTKNDPQNNLVKNCKYSIKHLRFTKDLNYVRSSDFLKPGLELSQKTIEENQKNIPKTIIHSNDMLKTWFDTKYKQQNIPSFLGPREDNFIEQQTSILTPVEINKVPKFNFNFIHDKATNLPQFNRELMSEKTVPIFNNMTNLQKHFKNMDTYKEPCHNRHFNKYDFHNYENILQNYKTKLNNKKNVPPSQFFATTQITYNSHQHTSTKQWQSKNIHKTKFKKPFLNTTKYVLPSKFKIDSNLIFNKSGNVCNFKNRLDKPNETTFCNKNIKLDYSNYKSNTNHSNQTIDEKITNTNLNGLMVKNQQTFLQGFHRFLKTKNSEKNAELNITRICKEIIELNKNVLRNQNLNQISNNISTQNGIQQLNNNVVETIKDDCSISKISSLERLLKTQNINITPFCSENFKLNLTESNLKMCNFDLFQNTTVQKNIESTSAPLNVSNNIVRQKLNKESISQIERYSKSQESVSNKQKESETQNTIDKYCFTESEEDTEYLLKKMVQIKNKKILSGQKQCYIEKWIEDNQIYLDLNQNNEINSEHVNKSETKFEKNLKKSSNSFNERKQYLNEWFENNEKYLNLSISGTSKRNTTQIITSETNLDNKNEVKDNCIYTHFPSQSLFSKSVSNKINLSLVEKKNSPRMEIDENHKNPEKSQDIINNSTVNVLYTNEEKDSNQSFYSLPVNPEETEEREVNETKYTNDLDYSSIRLNKEQIVLTNLKCMEETLNNLNNQPVEEIEILVNPKDILSSNKSSYLFFKNSNSSEEKPTFIEERNTNENLNNKTPDYIDISVNPDYILNAKGSVDSYFKNINSSELVKEFEEIDKKNLSLEKTNGINVEETHKLEFNFKDPLYYSSSSNASTINRIISQEFDLLSCNKNEKNITNTAFNFNPSFLLTLKNMPVSSLQGGKVSEWMHQKPETGNSYYLNSRTGMTSFLSPKEVEGCGMTKRFSFMPKGMSPILLNTSTMVESKELSPNSKNILHETLANSDDELKTVKWMNYLQNSGKFCYICFYKTCSKINCL